MSPSPSPSTDVVVIGSSIAGLMHAVVLKLLGRNVLVLEARPRKALQARAAGLSLWPHAQKLLETMTGEGILLAEVPVPEDVRTISWALIHKALWVACFKRSDTDGSVTFETSKRVCGVQEHGDLVRITYKNTDGTEEETAASLVIATDGARLESKYAGYLAWRGTVSEENAPSKLEGTIDGKLAMFIFTGSYILAKDVVSPLLHRLFAQSTMDSLPLLTAICSFHNSTSSLALTLAQVLRGEKTSEEAQKKVPKYAVEQVMGSKLTGIVGMTGKMPEG
ncbi:FAD/NAD(P)-binding domain-containing protein [Ophiobolus disseminans]|uniref:FAD/NAD(P)-binding domain-containing protein n=1 Tax=Ophiobolus disseminans TaxID=1469910 RepID=A0A6A6ZD19_9PLEO|nr:FAD/NAD(P)-binding domain-containing protein [Ophiobolus disseminans]